MRRTIENWGFNLNINIERRGRCNYLSLVTGDGAGPHEEAANLA